MDISLLGMGAQLLLSVFGTQNSMEQREALDSNENQPVKIVYKCEKEKWTQEPKIKRGVMRGAISVACEFEGASNGIGGFLELEPYIHQRVKDEATKVHKGPEKLKKKYKNLEGQYYDITLQLASKNKKDSVNLRQDVFVATDEKDILHFDSFTTRVEKKKGNFKYFKKVDLQSRVESTNMANLYKVTVDAYFEVKKPWFAPGGYFKKEAKKMIAKETPQITEELVIDIAHHI